MNACPRGRLGGLATGTWAAARTSRTFSATARAAADLADAGSAGGTERQRAAADVQERAAKDAWAGHGAAPRRLCRLPTRETLLDQDRRKEAQTELASASIASEQHIPLHKEVKDLARREVEELQLLGTGATNAEIGRRL